MSPHAELRKGPSHLADLSPGRPNFGNSAAVWNRTEKLCKQIWQTSADKDEAEDGHSGHNANIQVNGVNIHTPGPSRPWTHG